MKKFIVLLAVLVAVFAFSAQAMADVNLYGSARFQTYSVKVDNTGAAYDDTDTVWKMDSLARFGAKFTSGDVGGVWELDARNSSATLKNDTSSLGDLRIRHLYGTWKFGAGELLIGQTWPLTDLLQSNFQYLDSGLQWYGGMGMLNARVTQLRLTFGNLALAFITPQAPLAASGVWGTTDTDITLPKIEVKYTLPLQPVTFNFVGGWQKYEEVNATDQTTGISSWVGAAQALAKFGPAYVNFCLHYAKNEGNYGLGNSSVIDDAYRKSGGAQNVTTTDIEDITTWGAELVVGYKVSDMVTIEAGYSKLKADGDNYLAAGQSLKDTAQAYYLNATFTMAPGVYIIPEFAILDKQDFEVAGVSTEETKTTLFGVFWKIDFK